MSRIQKVVTEVEEWRRRHVFNAQKDEVLVFTCARIKPKDMPNRLLIVNSRINFGQTVKYLGVTLDLLIGLNTSITK